MIEVDVSRQTVKPPPAPQIVRRVAVARGSPEEIFAEMRKAGFEQLADIKWAILEPDGKISVVPLTGKGTVSAASENPPV